MKKNLFKFLFLMMCSSFLIPALCFSSTTFAPHHLNTLNWYIDKIDASYSNGLYRVSCTILDQEIWFESNLPLHQSPEAFAGMFILPALAKNATIHINLPIDKEWHQNTEKAIHVYNEWWGFPIRNPIIAQSFSETFPQENYSQGSAFSCGVDSFYTLLSGDYNIDKLVFCQGFDVPLKDQERAARILATIDKICKDISKDYIFVRTNIRSHSLFRSFNWATQTHGSALIALGHLLSDHISSFVIPPSNYPEPDKEYGSHWRTDTFFSSSIMKIIHTEQSEHGGRPYRTATIAHQPLVQNHLRVCWLNNSPWNCSHCEKCVRTMIDLCACNALEKFTDVFDLSIPLATRIYSLSKMNADQIYLLEKCLQQNLPLDVKNALQKVIVQNYK